MNFQEFVSGFNERQLEAVYADKNVVVSAGAGSGKTTVLSARYVRLIVEENIKVDEILALTFTNKAAAEMHSRIYRDLQKFPENKNAQNAIKNFQKAQIITLDSFCNSVARLACRKYGVSPDFSIDLLSSNKFADDLAMSFFLKHRKNNSLQKLMGNSSIDSFVNNFFAKILREFVFISKPISLDDMLEKQKSVLSGMFSEVINNVENIISEINYLENIKAKIVTEAKRLADNLPEPPINLQDETYLEFIYELIPISKISLKGQIKDPAGIRCKELINEMKKELQRLTDIYNFKLNLPLISEMFSLIKELQEEFIEKKRCAGILNYGDIAQLALDGLKADTELRRFFKTSIKSIMIDEFQDNNKLQRDILFFLAENLDKEKEIVPAPNELSPEKLFFVGDEKQSIYAFRGADVSVFRKLIKDLNSEIQLAYNYRSETQLLNIFNSLFPFIFYSEKNMPIGNKEIPEYEAVFDSIGVFQNTDNVEAGIELMLADKKRMEKVSGDSGEKILTARECEAAYLARRIRELYDSKYKVRGKNGARECNWSDFVILLRASTHQGVYERYLKAAGIPYTATQQKGIFNDAPLNDMYSIFRLAVYPNDKACYAQVLKTPFVNISDEGFTSAMLTAGEPFNETAENLLNPKDKKAFIAGRVLFQKISSALKTKTNAEIISLLWYDEAYKYLILSEPSYRRFAELYDYFFELANRADKQGLTHVDFIDLLYTYIEGEEKIDEMDIPLDQEEQSVKIMSVHKSKGLEFPIVCIADSGSNAGSAKKEGLVFYSEETGLSLHIPSSLQELSIEAKNPFFEAARQLENLKICAEVKRLLYVAMTRAEAKVIITGVSDKIKSAEEISEAKDLEVICSEYNFKEDAATFSFFDLLFSALQRMRNKKIEGLIFNEILPIRQKEFFSFIKKQKQNTFDVLNIEDICSLYSKAEIKNFQPAKKKIFNASSLAEESWEDIYKAKHSLQTVSRNNEAAELGIFTHAVIEAYFNGNEIDVPAKYKDSAEKFKNNFFNSELGKKALNADFRKPEYGFITRMENKTITGIIDLIFEAEDTVFIVDYKTDKIEEAEKHKTQLAVYRKAVSELYKIIKPDKAIIIKTFLFYVRTGNAVEL